MNTKQISTIVIGVLLLAGIGVWGLSMLQTSAPSSTIPLGHAETRELHVSLLEQGTLQPYDYDKISIETNQVDEFQIKEVVANGTYVEKGEVLLRLDDSQVAQQIEDAKLNLESAKNNLLVAKEEKKKQVLEAEMDIQAARSQLEMARKNLEKFNSMEDEKNREEKEMSVKQARVKVEEMRSEVNAAEEMQEKGLISEAKLDRTRIDLEDARFQLQKAQMEAKIYKDYTAPNKKTELRNKVERKKKQLESRKSFLEAIESQKQSDVNEARAKLDNARQKLNQLREDRNMLTVKAPSSGIVNYGSPGGDDGYGDDDDQLEEGTTINRGESLMYIPDLNNMYVHVPVDEGDISKLLKTGPSADTSEQTDAIDLSELDRQDWMTVFRKAGQEKLTSLFQRLGLNRDEISSIREGLEALSDEQKEDLKSFVSNHLETRSKRFKRLRAQITSESFPNAELTGTLDYVAGAASEESWFSDVKQFDTKVKLNQHYDWFRPGMNVKVELIVEQTDPVLTVPINAIFSGDGRLFCFRKTSANQFEKVLVQTNRSDGNHVEIIAGALEDGDPVALARPDDDQIVSTTPLPDASTGSDREESNNTDTS